MWLATANCMAPVYVTILVNSISGPVSEIKIPLTHLYFSMLGASKMPLDALDFVARVNEKAFREIGVAVNVHRKASRWADLLASVAATEIGLWRNGSSC